MKNNLVVPNGRSTFCLAKMRFDFLLIVVFGLLGSTLSSHGQDRRPGPIPLGRPAPCCGIIGVNTSTGVVSAKENATGRIFQFKVNDTKLLNSLKTGQGVYANFAANQVSLDGSTNCCAIIPPHLGNLKMLPDGSRNSGSPTSNPPSGSGPAPIPVCAGPSTMEGVDVSQVTGTVNWKQVRASGRTFAYARATNGLNFVDPTFAQNYAAIKSAGLMRGAYQTFDATADPVVQANKLLSLIGTLQSGDLPPALDVSQQVPASVSALPSKVAQWIASVQAATGRTPIVYASHALLQQALGSGVSVDSLWIANWNVTCPLLPAAAHQWVFWQYAGTGTVPGIQGQVDLNRFNGNLASLTALAKSSTPHHNSSAAGVTIGPVAPGSALISPGLPPVTAGIPPTDNYTLEVQGPSQLTTNNRVVQLYVPPDAVRCARGVDWSGCQQ